MDNLQIFNLLTKENIKLKLNLYRSTSKRKNITILYFHGGGLLYGIRDDLPKIYTDKFLDQGYDILAFDYPLAPESNLNTILEVCYEEILYFLNNYNSVFNLDSNDYILFGRSAGGYLVLITCDRIIKNNIKKPLSIISLYGYSRLDEADFKTPSKYYKSFPKVTEDTIENLISDKPIVYAPINSRFSLYIKARQDASWINYLCSEEDINRFSVDTSSLKNFPPTILSAATLDPDVPYKCSKFLSRNIPNSKLITVYKDVHDFDRDLSAATGAKTYDEIITWLENQYS
ncbi:alpha/beta hydrolase [Clostridium gasigenes]|uniref:alpha/beta hydrolase fold domain-containing protein n=1 Tax=Clostridium gasigenes TaxID=94869 RepID=UPI001C0E49B1|nr:alpha/beta hydrolase [Clostridium gasigenes]MBU3138229.1 alpha/beta hydrolase [Clostridium gasigenes]